MAYPIEILNRAKASLEESVRLQRETYEEHLKIAYEVCPRLQEIDSELRSSAALAAAAAFRRKEDPEKAVEAAAARNRELQRERAWLIDANFEDDYLDDSPVCALCGGTGYVGSKMCECLDGLCRIEQKKAISRLIGTGKERFGAFKLDLYSNEYDRNLGSSPRELMSADLEECRSYAASFSQTSPSMLFTGKPGLGKTFLSACIARVVVEKGFSVVYDSVIQILSEYETVKFGENTEDNRRNLDKYSRCDLLIIDDLGTEMQTQFTLSALYTVINARIASEKPMIVSTNLSPREIRDRYTPALASRLLGGCKLVYFYGEDIRLRGKL